MPAPDAGSNVQADSLSLTDAGSQNHANLGRDRAKRRSDYTVARQGGPRAAGARGGQVDVDVVAVEAQDVKLSAVDPNERRQHFAAHALDLFPGPVVQVGIRVPAALVAGLPCSAHWVILHLGAVRAGPRVELVAGFVDPRCGR
jgi:hypothetical protein